MRAQTSTAGPAAATVILTGLFIILYILFLPPADREALLGNATPDDADPSIIDELDVLLEESPGLVSPLADTSETRSLNPVTLLARGEYVPVFTTGETEIFSSRYDKSVYDRSFTIDAVPSDARLSLALDEVSGEVRVTVNGQDVYSGRPQSRTNKEILDLPLERGENTITIESAEKWWFWGENRAEIRSVNVIADVYNPSLAQSEQRFSLPQQNRQYLERAYLRFLLSCDSLNQQIVIKLNGYRAGSSVFDCESPQQIELPIEDMRDTNTISFEAGRGVAVIESPTIRFLYEEAVHPLYYFRLDDDQWEDLEDGDKDAILYMRFVRDSNDKDLIADLNGNFVSVRLDRDEYEYREDVTRFVLDGENYLELEPRRAANIVDLELFLVSAD